MLIASIQTVTFKNYVRLCKAFVIPTKCFSSRTQQLENDIFAIKISWEAHRYDHPQFPATSDLSQSQSDRSSDSRLRITMSFKDQKSADKVRSLLRDLERKINQDLQPIFKSSWISIVWVMQIEGLPFGNLITVSWMINHILTWYRKKLPLGSRRLATFWTWVYSWTG